MACVVLSGDAESGSCRRGKDKLSNLSSESTLTESNGLCAALDDDTVSLMYSIEVWPCS